jgi:hypothetical protein
MVLQMQRSCEAETQLLPMIEGPTTALEHGEQMDLTVRLKAKVGETESGAYRT